MSTDFERLPWEAAPRDVENVDPPAPTATLEPGPAPPQPNVPTPEPTVENKRFVGMLIGGLFVAFMLVIWIGAVQSVGELTGIDGLVEGDCVAEFFPDTEFVSTVTRTAPCDQPHAYEVFKVITYWDINDDAMFPGVEALEQDAEGWCSEAGAEILDHDGGLELAIWTFVPTDASWARGERDITCLVGDWGEQELLTGRLLQTVGL